MVKDYNYILCKLRQEFPEYYFTSGGGTFYAQKDDNDIFSSDDENELRIMLGRLTQQVNSGLTMREEKKMNKHLEKLMLKYENVNFTFSSYFKYEFIFSGDFNGNLMKIVAGGTADDIYRMDIESDKTYSLFEIENILRIEESGEPVYEKPE